MKPNFCAMLMLAAATASSLSAAPQPRPPIEYFPAPALPDGQRAPFSSAVRVGDVVYLSGAIGIAPDGKLPATFEGQAKQVMDNIGASLKTRGLGYDRLFKCTVMLENIADWPTFNKIYMGYFPDGPLPARSAFGTDGLALGALIELECWAWAGRR